MEDFEFFQVATHFIDYINEGMESGHTGKPGDFWMASRMGSYGGVTMKKDMKIAQCDSSSWIPQQWRQFKDYISNNSKILRYMHQSFENVTMDTFFINIESSTMGIGKYNLSGIVGPHNLKQLNSFDIYFIIENINQFASKLISQYSPRSFQDSKIQRKRTINDLGHKNLNEKNSNSTKKITRENINSKNIQKCWEDLVTNSFAMVEPDMIHGYLSTSLFYYTACIPHVQVMTLYAFGIISSLLFKYKGLLATHLPCLYDIINSKDLQFDMDWVQNKASLLQALVVPFGPHGFSTLLLRLAESGDIIFNHENIDEVADDLFTAIEDKLRSVNP